MTTLDGGHGDIRITPAKDAAQFTMTCEGCGKAAAPRIDKDAAIYDPCSCGGPGLRMSSASFPYP